MRTFSLPHLIRLGGLLLSLPAAAVLAFALFSAQAVLAPAPVAAGCSAAGTGATWTSTEQVQDSTTGSATYSNTGAMRIYEVSSNNAWCYTYKFNAAGSDASSVLWSYLGSCALPYVPGTPSNSRSYFFKSSGDCVTNLTVRSYAPPNWGQGSMPSYVKITSCSNYLAPITTYTSSNLPFATCAALGTVVGGAGNIFVDTQLPNPPILSPASTLYTSATSGTVSWTDSDPGPSSGILSHYVGWRRADASCTGPWGAWSFGWVDAASWVPGWGSNTCFQYTVRTEDNAQNLGNNGYSAAIISDQIAPSATTTLNTAADWYNSSTITSSWTTSDGGSGVNNLAHYRRSYPSSDGNGSCAGTPSGWTTLSNAGSGSLTQTGLTNGACYLWATDVIDRAGNGYWGTNGPGPGASKWVMIDTSPPVFGGFTTPASNPFYTSSSSATFTWNAATDNASGIDPSGAYHRVLQTAAISSPGVCGGAWSNVIDDSYSTATSIVKTGLGNQCYREAVAVRDRAGNPSAWNYSNPVLVDNVKPVVTWYTPAAAGNNMSGTITPAWVVTENGSGNDPDKPGTVIRWYQDSSCSGLATNDGEQTNGSPVLLVSGRCYFWSFSDAAPPADKAGNSANPTGLTAPGKINAWSQAKLSVLRAGATILDCGDPSNQSKQVPNNTGIVYWGVAQPLCLVPWAAIWPPGPVYFDTSDPHTPLIGWVKSVDSYKLGADPNDPAEIKVTWPTSEVGVTHPWNLAAPYSLPFVINRETSLASTSKPWVLVPYQATVTIAWCPPAAAICPSPVLEEQSVINLQLRLVGLNSGQRR